VDFIVLDTDIASLNLKGRLPARLRAVVSDKSICVTFVTAGELTQWADLRSWGRQSWAELDEWLGSALVLDYDKAVARTWGRLSAAARRRGRPRQANDTWIAACCLAEGLPLATRNVKDYVDFADHHGLTLVQS
jgi:toxin FitB